MTGKLSKEELETMSYSELTELILKEAKKKMKIVDIFRKICNIKGLSDAEFEGKISDFFELISTNKNFIILEKGFCDLRANYTPNVLIEEEDEDIIETDASDIIDDTDEEDEDIYYDNSSDEDDINDDNDDGLEDLYVIDEEETNM